MFIVTLFILQWTLPSEGVVMCAMLWSQSSVNSEVSRTFMTRAGLSRLLAQTIQWQCNVCVRPYPFVVSPLAPPPHHYDDIRSPLIHGWYEGGNMEISGGRIWIFVMKLETWLGLLYDYHPRSTGAASSRHSTHFLATLLANWFNFMSKSSN